MEKSQIIVGLIVVILAGLLLIPTLRRKRNKEIPEQVVDEIRRVLWEQGSTPTNFRMITIWEAFKHFGLAAMPNAAYRDDYFVEVTATNENGKEEIHITRIVLAFEKDVIETEWKK